MLVHEHIWSITGAFAKFGFDDGDGCNHTRDVEEALTDSGEYTTYTAFSIHNGFITEVYGSDGKQILEFDGYNLPNWDSLPEMFREALINLDSAVEAEWKRGIG